MKEIKFSEEENWDGSRGEIFFHAQLSDQDGLVSCRVPSDILRDFFGAPRAERNELTTTFHKRKAEIEEITKKLLEAQRYEEDGTILIRRQDLLR